MRAQYLLLVLVSVPACAQGWQPDEFPVGFWCGPPAACNKLEAWQTVKDCGFTWAMGAGYGVDGNRQMLDFCQQVGRLGA